MRSLSIQRGAFVVLLVLALLSLLWLLQHHGPSASDVAQLSRSVASLQLRLSKAFQLSFVFWRQNSKPRSHARLYDSQTRPWAGLCGRRGRTAGAAATTTISLPSRRPIPLC
jgi:hypothetical protein